MDAEQRIRRLLESVREDGILQSEIHNRLNLSKSTVSEILTTLEYEKEVVRKKISGKSYRVWLTRYSPEPVEGVLRIGILRASEYPKVVAAAESLNAFIRVYDSSIELTKDLVHGYVDAAASPFITQAFFGVLMKTVTIVRKVALNGSGLVFSRTDSQWWGCSEFSTMERNLRKYMDMHGIDGKIRYFRSPESMINSLPELRAIAIWEPYFTMLENLRKERFCDVLGDYLCCTLAFNNSFLEVNPDIEETFLREFDRARAGRREAKILADVTGFESNLILKSFENYELYPEQKFSKKELEELRLGGIEGIIRLD
ncbi:hypothetical protein [Archaeoglobus neptunius]|uniref:hypothetical protein n=1 Tax=Archaeoglobus neptunius TaxID=2798580 RepID=UPI001927F90C|nr:hypothetical protein [Archaeoglobus neptunius]